MAVTAFRLKLDVDEETRARWHAAAERIGYERLDVWARDTLDAASDPDAGQVVGVETIGDPDRVEIRARLTTAETERDTARREHDTLKGVHKTLQALNRDFIEQTRAAEARVEALSKALAEIEALYAENWQGTAPNKAMLIARAALACPPPEEEK